MEKKKSFVGASTSGSKEKPIEEVDPSIITTFLKTCMKLLRDSKALKHLQELINRCASKDSATGEPCMVRKLRKHKAKTGHEMRLTV